MPKFIFKKNGQSLVEVLVSLAIILMVLLGIVIATTYTLKNANFSKNQSLATKYAQEKMEQIRSDRDQSPDAFFDKDTPVIETIGVFTRQTTYIPAGGADAGKKTEVNVTVSWTDQTGTHQANQSSVFTKW